MRPEPGLGWAGFGSGDFDLTGRFGGGFGLGQGEGQDAVFHGGGDPVLHHRFGEREVAGKCALTQVKARDARVTRTPDRYANWIRW